ncbi:uncharacterized protein C8R40DRAFT_1060150 [Lentinula edodes]|uniref:uncharacterized protein n=1 Tax=Lentinula edodes TaxID=5353 RepID=UPI001E8D88B9|nr:uncharacterized protein C8R40DRAFT_1060150 [Lentinula edodes]KAH7869167.1 hypothetical protein C8R40DRAFT_1060150 [Lentinula edodes]
MLPHISIDDSIVKKYALTKEEWQAVQFGIDINHLSYFLLFRTKLLESETNQKMFHEWLQTQKLDSLETAALACRTFRDVAEFWSDRSTGAESQFKLQHRTGWKLWTKKYQEFSEGALSFMQDLKPLFDIVTGMGIPYVGLAIGTVTMLFTFSGKKNTIEEELSSAIEGIRDRLPGLKMYQAIYTENNELELDVQKKILFAYLAFIELSMEITRYFTQPGYRRWSTAFFNSSKFKDMTIDVYKSLSDIRLRCEELVGLRIDILVHGMESLKGRNEELQQDRNTAHLLEVQNALGLGSWTPVIHRKMLAEYRTRLFYEHDEEVIYQQMTQKEIEQLQCTIPFADWAKPNFSSVLILRGINNENLSQGKIHNWLSPLPLHLISQFHKDGANPQYHASHIFDPADPASRSLFKALPMILLQLLWPHRANLGSNVDGQYETLMAALHDYIACPLSRSDEKAQALGNLAAHVIGFYKGQRCPVYIVLDRVDQCSEHYELMSILVNKIIKGAPCPVKVLLVAGSMNWPTQSFFRFDLPVHIQEIVMKQKFLDDNDY